MRWQPRETQCKFWRKTSNLLDTDEREKGGSERDTVDIRHQQLQHSPPVFFLIEGVSSEPQPQYPVVDIERRVPRPIGHSITTRSRASAAHETGKRYTQSINRSTAGGGRSAVRIGRQKTRYCGDGRCVRSHSGR